MLPDNRRVLEELCTYMTLNMHRIWLVLKTENHECAWQSR